MKKFKTLKDFYRAIKVGVKVHTIWHLCPNGIDENKKPVYRDVDMGSREVSVAQTNSFALGTVKEGKIMDSWCQWPKAKMVKIDNDKLIIFTEDLRSDDWPKPLIPVLTYTIIEEQGPHNSYLGSAGQHIIG